MTIGDRLKLLREKHKISQTAFANSINKSRGMVGAYEINKYVPQQTTIALISRLYGVSEKWLLTGEGEMEINDSDALIQEITDHFNLGTESRKIMSAFLNMPEKKRIYIVHAAKALISFLIKIPEDKREALVQSANALIDLLCTEDLKNVWEKREREKKEMELIEQKAEEYKQELVEEAVNQGKLHPSTMQQEEEEEKRA